MIKLIGLCVPGVLGQASNADCRVISDGLLNFFNSKTNECEVYLTCSGLTELDLLTNECVTIDQDQLPQFTEIDLDAKVSEPTPECKYGKVIVETNSCLCEEGFTGSLCSELVQPEADTKRQTRAERYVSAQT
jgi:hypothetical protein